MGEATDRIVAEITYAREDMERDFKALQTHLKREVDPWVQVRRHPWVLAAIATGAALGIVLFVRSLRT